MKEGADQLGSLTSIMLLAVPAAVLCLKKAISTTSVGLFFRIKLCLRDGIRVTLPETDPYRPLPYWSQQFHEQAFGRQELVSNGHSFDKMTHELLKTTFLLIVRNPRKGLGKFELKIDILQSSALN